jgi:hypothetical protein
MPTLTRRYTFKNIPVARSLGRSDYVKSQTQKYKARKEDQFSVRVLSIPSTGSTPMGKKYLHRFEMKARVYVRSHSASATHLKVLVTVIAVVPLNYKFRQNRKV